MRSKKLVGLGVTAVLVLALTACGSSPTTTSENSGSSTDTFTKLNGMSPHQQLAKAIKLAKKEGEVSVYGSITPDVFNAIKKQFTKKYGIKVNVYRGSPEDVQLRVEQEASAGHPGADVVDTDYEQMASLTDKDVFAKYRGSHYNQVDKAGQMDHWVADRFDLIMPAWNTDLIKEGQEPRTWEDLADPKYDGKMTMEDSDFEWYGALTTYWLSKGKSQAEIDKLWKDIASGASVTSGHTAMSDLLSSGQVGVDAMNYSYLIDLAAKKDAPVTYREKDGTAPVPAFQLPFGLGLVANAPHPAAAWLFNDWMLTKNGGQALFAASSVLPSTELDGNPILNGVTLVPFPVEEVHKDNKKYATEYDALLRDVPKQ